MIRIMLDNANKDMARFHGGIVREVLVCECSRNITKGTAFTVPFVMLVEKR